MTDHRVAVFVQARGLRMARCSCGWEGLPRVGYDPAELEGRAHLEQLRSPPVLSYR